MGPGVWCFGFWVLTLEFWVVCFGFWVFRGSQLSGVVHSVASIKTQKR